MDHLLKKTMPRDASELLGLQIVVSQVVSAKKTKAELLEALNPSDLVYLITTDEGPPGICSLSSELLSALIEVQMSGRVTDSAPPDRAPTRTDGIFGSDIIDRWISTAKKEADVQVVTEHLPFYRHYRAQTLSEIRTVDLSLDPGQFRTLAISMEISGGVKSGLLTFATPVINRPTVSAGSDTADRFRLELMQTRVGLPVVLTRLPQTIRQVRQMSVGDMLEIPLDAIHAVTLVGRKGEILCTGRLGQEGGQKAVLVQGNGQKAKAGTLPTDGAGSQFSERTVFQGAPDKSSTTIPPEPGIQSLPAPETKTEMPLSSSMPLADLPDLPALPELPELPDLPD